MHNEPSIQYHKHCTLKGDDSIPRYVLMKFETNNDFTTKNKFEVNRKKEK